MKLEGLHADRTQRDGGSSDRERVFAERWQLKLDGGLLDVLMMKDAAPEEPGAFRTLATWGNPWATKPMGDATEKDRIIAATVVQWLGTNVGFAFLEETLRLAGYEVRPIPKKK